jgi:hypothetical protein
MKKLLFLLLLLSSISLYSKNLFEHSKFAKTLSIGTWQQIGITGWLPEEQIDSVTALKSSGPTLYIGAKILNTNTNVARDKVYKWDGTTWSAIGNGFNNRILAIEIHGGNVYAAGEFTTGNAANTTLNRIAKWDAATSAWLAVSSGMNNTIRCLTVGVVDGSLYAGGDFTNAGTSVIRRVAKMTVISGISYWSNVTGSKFPNNTVYSIQTKASPQSGFNDIYIAGAFTTIGTTTLTEAYGRIAMYRNYSIGGSPNWFHLGTEMNDTVFDMRIDNQGGLYAAGAFTTANGQVANRIAYWNSANWFALGTGLNQTAFSIAINSDNNVVVAGKFSTAGGQTVNNIAYWNQTDWEALGTGTNAAVKKVAAIGYTIYAGGLFTDAGGMMVNKMAKFQISIPPAQAFPIIQNAVWDNSCPFAIDPVYCIIKDGLGNLYANGKKWNGTTWQNLGTGLNDEVRAMAVDASNNLYVTGHFTTAGGITVNGIAKWNGSAWSALGGGLNGVNSIVGGKALYISGTKLYVGGGFGAVDGTVICKAIAQFDLTTNVWTSVGTALENGTNGEVRSIISDNAGGILIGGDFTKAGTVNTEGVAKWNGTVWSKLGVGLSNCLEVNSLVMDAQNNLYAGGWFENADARNTMNIAKWNGSQWFPLGSGVGDVNSYINTLAIDNGGKLWAGGSFVMAGGGQASKIAIWNGTKWGTVKDGANEDIYAIYPSVDDIFIGGFFDEIGGIPANYFSKLKHCITSTTLSGIINTPSDQQSTFLAGTTINSTATIQSPTNTLYSSGNSITLNPGFKTTNGAVFLANIKGCTF